MARPLLRRSSPVLALVGLAIGLALPARAHYASVEIKLLSPAHNASAPRVNRSPRFTWSVSDAGSVGGVSYLLEVSTDPKFEDAVAVEGRHCEASRPACWTGYQWKTDYWYRESDSCANTPPSGRCRDGATATGIYYWRVRASWDGGEAASGVRTLRVVRVTDREKPRVAVYAGSAQRGTVPYVTASISDNSHFVRVELTLSYAGHVRLRARVPFGRIRHSWTYELSTSSVIPRDWPTGRYTVCVRAWDRAGNTGAGCAPYSIS